jgi:hypothetical protein
MRLVTLLVADDRTLRETSVRGCLDRENLSGLQFMCFGHIEDQLNAMVAQNPDTFDPCPEPAVDEHVAVPRPRASDQSSDDRCSGPVLDSDRIGHLKARCHPRAILMYAIEWACVRARKLSSMIASGSAADTAVAEM